VPLATCFDLGLFDSVRLQKRVQMTLIAPTPVVVVVAKTVDFDVADETSSTDVFFTLGAEWNFARWAIRGQYELYDTEGDSQDVIYVGASFRF